jgi:hypothetical protein
MQIYDSSHDIIPRITCGKREDNCQTREDCSPFLPFLNVLLEFLHLLAVEVYVKCGGIYQNDLATFVVPVSGRGTCNFFGARGVVANA